MSLSDFWNGAGITRLPSLILYSIGGISHKSSASPKSSEGNAVIEPAETSIFIPFAVSQPWRGNIKALCSEVKRKRKPHLELVQSN